jgi:4-hydroxy-tetrahydrodipicolinate synthase
MSEFSYLKGIYNITPTPFHADGSVDEPSLGRLTEFMITSGCHGMTILGVLGECERVLETERDRIIAVTVEAARGRIPICVGTSHAGTDCCIAYSKRAQQLGARAIMVAPPKLFRSDDAALRAHYLAVADAIDIPIVIQDHPPSSGATMSVNFIASIANETPLCAFLKLEDEPTPWKMSQVRRANPNVQMFGGQGGYMFLEELAHGAIGTMTGFSFPEVLVEVYRKFVAGDVVGATEVFCRFVPLIRFENQPRINLPLRKEIYVMRRLIAAARCRAPFARVDEDTLKDLNVLLTHLGISAAELAVT